VLKEHFHRRVPLEHELARQQIVRDAAQGVHVRPPIDLAAENDFRGHERGCTGGGVIGRQERLLSGARIAELDQTEVEHLDEVVLEAHAADVDVRRLDVAVREAARVRFGEGQARLVEKVDRKRLSAGQYTLEDILAELKRPGRDPRETFVAPQFREEVRGIADVQVGMVLEGVVTNVTKFGAFVDIGVHQDGLVHISELSNKFIKDPAEAVKTGQIVKVKVLSVDAKAMRIGLSMKALMASGTNSGQRPQQGKKALTCLSTA